VGLAEAAGGGEAGLDELAVADGDDDVGGGGRFRGEANAAGLATGGFGIDPGVVDLDRGVVGGKGRHNMLRVSRQSSLNQRSPSGLPLTARSPDFPR